MDADDFDPKTFFMLHGRFGVNQGGVTLNDRCSVM